MPSVRLIATDIDGTLVNNRSEISKVTVEVLQRVLDDGILVVLVTGLNPWPVRRYVQQIGHGIKAICLNGIFYLDHGHLEAGSFIDVDVAIEAVHHILQNGYVPLVYGADSVTRYIPGTPDAMAEVASLIRDRPYQPFVTVNDVDALFEIAPAQVSVCDTIKRAAMLFPKLESVVGDRAYVVYQPARRSWVEVNHPEARKDVALLALARRLDITPDEILYFGDSLNDIPVFRAISYPVAVANARPEVLALAWQTALSNNEHGVARYLASLFELDAILLNEF